MLPAIQSTFSYSHEVLVEQYVQGEELTCSILNGTMLPVLAIKPASGFFDYTSKYTNDGTEEYVVELEKDIFEKVKYAALKAYTALKCSVYARVDIIVGDGFPYVLEVNTLPGMTKNSLFPKSAAAAGIAFPQLLDQIIEGSVTNK